MTVKGARWLKSLFAVLLGFAFYYNVVPWLPQAARHKPMELDLGVVVIFWFCLFMYGIIEAGVQLSRWLRNRKQRTR